ncbi:hypothetical protein H2200_013264 [Cladophialophora chaetospira]|uniref:Uncharacterized protein n=1 Tax=Cladophialophora chaetospira TaxID=386627 RepID=A0AA38TZ91_9EURO|nr:hypothetical protein H2200_013264 [Cladophialophora chaetospira]
MSAQAVMTYILMLAAAGESAMSQNKDLPTVLLFTMRVHYDWLNQYDQLPTAAENHIVDVSPIYDDWLFAESKSRTAMLYFVFGLFFNLEFGLPCDRNFDYLHAQVHLPAAKTLWEAIDESAWREEYGIVDEAEGEILKYGDLKWFNKQDSSLAEKGLEPNERQSLAQRIRRWQEDMDEFGMLVSLSSTME